MFLWVHWSPNFIIGSTVLLKKIADISTNTNSCTLVTVPFNTNYMKSVSTKDYTTHGDPSLWVYAAAFPQYSQSSALLDPGTKRTQHAYLLTDADEMNA